MYPSVAQFEKTVSIIIGVSAMPRFLHFGSPFRSNVVDLFSYHKSDYIYFFQIWMKHIEIEYHSILKRAINQW